MDKNNVHELLQRVKVKKKDDELSPHKYILLLSISELLDNDGDHNNNFTYDELEPVFLYNFNKYFKQLPNHRKLMEYPFYHLQSDGFWFLKVKLGKEELFQSYQQKRLTKKRLLETIDYAYLDPEIFGLFKVSAFRQELQTKIDKLLNSLSLEDKKTTNDIVRGKEITSLFEHEQDAINLISDSVKKNNIGSLASNILIYDDQSNNYFEIDILLATPFELFVIELKHWSGNIRVEPHNWLVNEAYYRPDPHKVNSYKAKIVKGLYQHHFKTYPDIWVESVVVLTNPDVIIEGAVSPGIVAEQRKNNLTFASIDDLMTFLKKKKNDLNNYVLDNGQVEAVSNYFAKLSQPKHAVKYLVDGYETLEYISRRPECIELIARPLKGFGQGLNRFRIFRKPIDASPKEQEYFLKRAQNTIQAVSQIGDHPNIHKVWMIKNEIGDIIEGSEWSETGTLRDLMLRKNRKFEVNDALEICLGIAEALKVAHENNVIHRAIKPENILILNDVPKLLNFDLAYQLENSRLTVIDDPSKLKDDGYITPEILFGNDIDESSDFFSLGVIAYELLAGVKPFASTKEFVAKKGEKGQLDEENLKRLKQDRNVPDQVIAIINNMLMVDRVVRIKDVNKIISAFRLGARLGEDSKEIPLIPNKRLEPGNSYDVYEITEYLGGGKESQIYKAKTLKDRAVALKVFNKEVPRERIFKEAEITSLIKSSYVVRCENKIGYWKNDRYFIVLEYISGVSLRNIIAAGEKPDLDTFKTVALGLMEAIRAFHQYRDSDGTKRPILHSDIKPDNIILAKDKGILTDCGISGEPRIDTFRGTKDYIPPDCISGTDMIFSEAGDLYALGITLWEWLFGCKPYENASIGDKATIPHEKEESIPNNIKNWLIKAVSTEANNRFSTIDDMQQAFTKQLEDIAETTRKSDVEQKIDEEITFRPISSDISYNNPFVTYLNSLSNVSAGNENATAEAQITNDFFNRIQVKNPITDFIYEKLVSEKRNVVLTGNAGDGKTTIAADIFIRLTGERRPLNPQEILDDHNIVIIKDMSEIDKKAQVSVLNEALNSEVNYLIVSNTGTLLDSFSQLSNNGYRVSSSELLKALTYDGPCEIINNKFLVVNIGQLDSIKTGCTIFQRMLEPENWKTCLSCTRTNDCPIYTNVILLQQKLDVVYQRVMLIYQRLFEYNVRLTLRQMTGHLAYAITAGIDCKTIMEMTQASLEKHLTGYLFFNRFFGDDGQGILPEALQLFPVRQILKEEFGVVLDPHFEREAWMKEGAAISKLNELNIPTKIAANFSNSCDLAARKQLRRLLYFFDDLNDEVGKRFTSVFLRSPMLLEYINILESSQEISTLKKHHLRSQILQVMQESFIGIKLPESQTNEIYITIKQGITGSGAQMVLADFKNSNFELITKPRYTVGTEEKRILCLKYNDELEPLELDLPFFDFVARRYKGEVTEELSAFYTDRLERFKIGLLEHYYKSNAEDSYLRLMMIDPERKFKFMKIAIDENSLEVLR